MYRLSCIVGTVRYSDTVDDGTTASWNGATNNDIADTKADCIVCPSGYYDKINLEQLNVKFPAGTMRAADNANR